MTPRVQGFGLTLGLTQAEGKDAYGGRVGVWPVRSVIFVSPVHTGTQPVGMGDTQIR